MKAFQIMVSGNWGHFKKPETNNNPLTHDLITKTALIGLIGAVLGIERNEMKAKFPELSENLLYSVQLLNHVKKVSWGFTSRTAVNPTNSGSPKYFEFLKNPKYRITLALQNDGSLKEFDGFLNAVKKGESVYTPVLGWHNCPANLLFENEGNISDVKIDDFETFSFISTAHKLEISGAFRIGFDKLPTFQNDDFWNLPEKYKQIVYPDFPNKIRVTGECYEYCVPNQEIDRLWLM